jgi:hypothetical protein
VLQKWLLLYQQGPAAGLHHPAPLRQPPPLLQQLLMVLVTVQVHLGCHPACWHRRRCCCHLLLPPLQPH